MKLHWFQVAPNPTKVRLYVAEKNHAGAAIELESVVVKLPKGEQRSPEFLSKNPFGGLPVLELDDGSTIVESLPIIDFFEELHPQPSLWGADARSRARARELERIADVRLLSAVGRYIHATRSPVGLPPNPAIAEAAAAAWPQPLVYLNDVLADGREFLCGSAPTVGDCTLQGALQFARFGEVKLELETRYPHIARWDIAYRERDVARQVLTL